MFGRWGVNYVRLGVVLEDATTCYHMHTRVGRSCHMHRHFIPDFHFFFTHPVLQSCYFCLS